jgi:hypothetical protein
MPIRRLAVIALACAVLVQAGWIAAYHRATGGCFCWVTGSPDPPPQPDVVYRYILGASYPLGRFAGPNPIHLPNLHPIAAEWLGALTYAAINAFFWFDALFLLMTIVAFGSRVRMDRTRRRPYLAAPVPIRRRSLAIGVLTLLLAGLTAGALHRRAWIAHADRLARAAIAAERGEAALPAEIDLNPYGALGGYTAAELAGPYVFLSGQARERPTHVLDTFVAPMDWTSEARFESGARLVTSVHHGRRGWRVSLWRTEPRT